MSPVTSLMTQPVTELCEAIRRGQRVQEDERSAVAVDERVMWKPPPIEDAINPAYNYWTIRRHDAMMGQCRTNLIVEAQVRMFAWSCADRC